MVKDNKTNSHSPKSTSEASCFSTRWTVMHKKNVTSVNTYVSGPAESFEKILRWIELYQWNGIIKYSYCPFDNRSAAWWTTYLDDDLSNSKFRAYSFIKNRSLYEAHSSWMEYRERKAACFGNGSVLYFSVVTRGSIIIFGHITENNPFAFERSRVEHVCSGL